jgi:hypothetical protein
MRSRTENEKILLGRWDRHGLDHMLGVARKLEGTGRRIEFISRQFLDVPYLESTLMGSEQAPEVFAINLEALDCFTYLDYVEAMRRSDDFASFKETLKVVRYRAGMVDYSTRNHFFTDWVRANPYVEDATAKVGRESVRTVSKRLNDRGDGTWYVPGIPPQERRITFIPGHAVDRGVIGRLRTGDYVGVYTPQKGLDVSHVGIIVKSLNRIKLRHASSSPTTRKVVEENLVDYLTGKPGVLVLRPRVMPRPSTR